MFALAAAFPFLLLFLLLIIFKKPGYVATPITFVATVIIAFFVWGMAPVWFLAASIKGFLVAFEIILIVFGAIFLLFTLKRAKAFLVIDSLLQTISKDRRIQAILIGWFFVSFIEGAAGFGTPAALAAPLLASVGFPPLAAVALSLIGDSTAVTFGAVGVPMIIGIGEGINPNQTQNIASLVSEVSRTTAFLHLAIGLFVPLVISAFLTGIFGKSFRKGLEIWPFALVCGLSFTIPYFFVAQFLGPEFPSLVGSLLGGGFVVFLLKKGLFTPKRTWDFNEEWRNKSHIASGISEAEDLQMQSVFRALLPYALIALILAVTRIEYLKIGGYLRSFSFSIESILGTEIGHNLVLLYSPGVFFLLVTLFSFFLFQLKKSEALGLINLTFNKIFYPFITLFAVVALVQVLIFSEHNVNDFPGMPFHLAQTAAVVFPGVWPLVAPLVGLFGGFMAGSSTVSNLLFADFQLETATVLGFPVAFMLALQSVGSAVGNMISIHNVVTAAATLGLHKEEGKIIRYNLLPALGYSLAVGLLALLLLALGIF